MTTLLVGGVGAGLAGVTMMGSPSMLRLLAGLVLALAAGAIGYRANRGTVEEIDSLKDALGAHQLLTLRLNRRYERLLRRTLLIIEKPAVAKRYRQKTKALRQRLKAYQDSMAEVEASAPSWSA